MISSSADSFLKLTFLYFFPGITPDRRQSKTLLLSTEVHHTSLETEFSIVICRQMAIENTVSGDFQSRFSINKSVFDCRLSGVGIPSECGNWF